MSSWDGITNSGVTWGSVATTGSPTSAGATSTDAQQRVDLSGIFARSFNRSLDTIFDRAQARVDADLDSADSGHSLAQVVPQAAQFLAAIEQRRDLVDQRLATSVNRLMEVATKLDAEYPLADVLAPSSTGTWDPATFRPRNETEAQAFAQRMAIDMTQAAARLDIVKNELDAARLDAQESNTTQARAKVDELTERVGNQMQYLAKLTAIVDGASQGSVADIGAEALGGASMRASDDVSTRELAREMRSMGFDAAEIERMLGAGEVSVEEQRTPGGSQRLRRIDHAMARQFCADFLIKMWDESATARREDDRARARRQATIDASHRRKVEARERANEELEQQRIAAIAEQQAALRAYLQQRARPA